MNIFFLDENPRLAAQYHVDKHVVKMILESAQILCTVIDTLSDFTVPYKSTHVNHPCTVWARQSRANAMWLYALMMELNDEYKYRYHKIEDHKSVKAFEEYGIFDKLQNIQFPSLDFTPPALAMPDYCQIYNNPVDCYRLYYKLEKEHVHKWTNREKPYWV